MVGTIKRIFENDFGQKYGFIEAEGVDYYFDNRYLDNGTMSDFYEEDTVGFIPSENPTNHRKLVARSVELNIKETMDSKKTNMLSTNTKVTVENVEYFEPEQEAYQNNKWYPCGTSKKLVLRGFSEDEVTIIKKLSGVLYNTNAGHFKTRDKNMNYGYSLFGPTKQFVIQLGLEKVEFALIFCDKEEFQRRTLEETFAYLTNNVIPKVRISGHFYLLVTKYSDIVLQIEKPDIQGSLQCSVIPFSYRELLDIASGETERFVLNRFKKFLFERNFFSYAEPISDGIFLFGGREQYAKGIADRSVSGEHSGIFGLRKSGKTSVINMIKQELDQRKALYVSYRCVEFVRHRWYQALNKIVRDIYTRVNKQWLSKEYTETNAIELFSADISRLFSIQEHTQLTIIFDEIEQISFDSTFDEIWQNSISFHLFWSAIITFCEKCHGQLSLVVAGINPSISEVDFLPSADGKATPRNPMYKKLSNDSYLIPFVCEQTKRMVNVLGKYMGLAFDNDVCFELQKDFGGHPYFTRQMCKTIVKHIRDQNLRDEGCYTFNITRPLYAAVKSSGIYEVESAQWCKDILKELKAYYPEEYQLLLRIPSRDVTTFDQVKRNPSVIPHLIGYGLVRFDSSSKEMEIFIDIVKQYLIKEKEYKKPFLSMLKNEIDEEIQDGISECEQPIRNLIRDVVSTLFDPSNAEKFIRSTKNYARDNKNVDLTEFDLGKLLDPRMVTLHFYILKDIICSYDSTFGEHFDRFKNKLYPYTKQEIHSYLSNIYVARNAADHHYEVHNEATLMNFRSSFFEIRKLLKKLGYIS